MASDRHPVDFLITFDFDAESIWKQKAKRGPWNGVSYESQGTFGPKVGLPRLLDVMRNYDVKATFFTPGWVAEKWPEAIAALLDEGHELAHHGYLHEFPYNFVAREDEELFLLRGKEALEKVSGKQVVGYRPAGYMYTDHTLDLLRVHGFHYGSGMSDDDAAYVHEDSGVAEIPVKWHLVDDTFGWHIDWGLPPSLVEEHWLSELRELGRFPDRIFVPTLHPQVMGHPGRLAMFERVLDVGRELGCNFRRCRDVADALLAKA